MAVQKARRIIVLGGSFNPPTLAHMRLLQSALDGLEAELGLFVPSSDSYVRRKMKRTAHPDEVLSEEMRLGLLKDMCQSDPRLAVSDAELAAVKDSGHTYETMCTLQQQYPEAELYFVFGADKLNVFSRWGTFEPFVNRFRLLIFCRDDFDPEMIFAKNQRLNAHRDSFVFLPQPEGTEAISSTAVRELLRAGKDVSGMLHPAAAARLLTYREGKA